MLVVSRKLSLAESYVFKCEDLFTLSWKQTNSSPLRVSVVFASRSGLWLQNATKQSRSGALQIQTHAPSAYTIVNGLMLMDGGV